MATIMIVEDDRQTNDAVSEYLKSFGHRMLSAYDGDEALQLFERSKIDLLILDIMLPKKTGLAVLHTIRQKSSVPILMLTAIGDEYTQVTSFDEQADDYITKPFSMVLLGRRVTALLRRSGQTVSQDTMTFGDVTVDFSGYTAKGPEGKIDITPKEIDLLKLLVEHKGLVLTRSQMLDNLWGADYPIIDRTIDTYIKNLRKKLRLDCIVTVKGIGYKFEVETCKKLKLFPKIFIYTLALLLLITMLASGTIYLLAPMMGENSVLSEGTYVDGMSSAIRTAAIPRNTEIAHTILRSLPYTIAICIVVSLLCAYIFSKAITNPIKGILDATNHMAVLDRKAACKTATNDEIGILANQSTNYIKIY